MNSSPVSELSDVHVSIVGLGLMGGSLAIALRPHVKKLTAVELDPNARRVLLERQMADEITGDLRRGIAQADLVVLATPVGTILQIIEQAPRLRPEGFMLLDLGSTKGQICAAMEALPAQFAAIGGHPMCGKESAGLKFAEETLYRNQTFVLCRTGRTSEQLERVAVSILDAIGAKPLLLEPQKHDRIVALVSHLPYFVSSALMQQAALAAADDERVWSVSASGFRDSTRLSGSDPHMLQEITITNRAAIVQALRSHASNIEALIALLESEDDSALRAWLQARQAEHGKYRDGR